MLFTLLGLVYMSFIKLTCLEDIIIFWTKKIIKGVDNSYNFFLNFQKFINIITL